MKQKFRFKPQLVKQLLATDNRKE